MAADMVRYGQNKGEMGMIQVIDRTVCKVIRQTIDEALKEAGKKLGVDIKTVGGGTFTENSYRVKVEAAVIGASGVVENKGVAEFKMFASAYGMKEEDLGREIAIYGQKYVIKGMASRSQKFPILAERADGKGFKLPLSAVKAALGYKLEPMDVY